MKKHLIVLLSIFLSGYAQGQIYTGAWVSDITPNENEFSAVCLGGYGAPYSRCGSSEVLDKITVRAISISDSDSEMILIVLDTVGIGDALSDRIKQKVHDWSHGKIKKDNIKTIATHTHSGPDLQGLWGGASDAYKDRVVLQSSIAAFMARTFSFKTKIFAANTLVDVENRRGWEVVDDSVNVLQFKSKRYNHTIATLINMSAHPTIMDETNMGYSSGFINSLRNKVESETYGLSIFVNGIVGDAQPVVSERTYLAAQEYGEGIGENLINALEQKERIKGELTIEKATLNHPLTNQNVLIAHSLGLIDIELNTDNTIDTEFTYFTIGKNLSGLGFPGEALSRLALPLKDGLDSKFKLFFGLYDDSYGYFIPSDEYNQIPERTTEENASIDIGIGDRSKEIIEELID